jgi:hypothetical protein
VKISWHKLSTFNTFVILTRAITIHNYNLNNICRVKAKAMGFTKIKACEVGQVWLDGYHGK